MENEHVKRQALGEANYVFNRKGKRWLAVGDIALGVLCAVGVITIVAWLVRR